MLFLNCFVGVRESRIQPKQEEFRRTIGYVAKYPGCRALELHCSSQKPNEVWFIDFRSLVTNRLNYADFSSILTTISFMRMCRGFYCYLQPPFTQKKKGNERQWEINCKVINWRTGKINATRPEVCERFCCSRLFSSLHASDSSSKKLQWGESRPQNKKNDKLTFPIQIRLSSSCSSTAAQPFRVIRTLVPMANPSENNEKTSKNERRG